MPALSISVHISPRAAILAGKASVGANSFSLTEEALKTLPEHLRFELALAYESGDPIGLDPSEPPVVEATLAAIRPVLEARAVARKTLDETKRMADARADEQAKMLARSVSLKDSERAKALRTWVEQHGDEEQKARMREGFLREEEILQDVTEELLDLPGHKVYEQLRRGDGCDCGCAHRVEFKRTAPPQYMDARQYSKLEAVRADAPASTGFSVQPVEHKAACPACSCVPIARLSAVVTLEWHGWLLAKEISID